MPLWLILLIILCAYQVVARLCFHHFKKKSYTVGTGEWRLLRECIWFANLLFPVFLVYLLLTFFSGLGASELQVALLIGTGLDWAISWALMRIQEAVLLKKKKPDVSAE